jgi:putative membrane-bound dehydrogenase-like protein
MNALRYTTLTLLILAAGLWLVHAAEPAKKAADLHSPLSPEQALKQFRVAPGLRVELVAAEPNLESPVAMAFDEDGRLWVVEMRDYPNGPAPGKPYESRIRILEDDGSGRYKHRAIFADHIPFANGVMPWRGGVLVTAAPHILFLRASDGGDRADQREVLFEGFAAQNPQLRVSHPILGIDNWIYVANGLRGGQVVRSGKQDAPPINLSGMDFRFDLLKDRYEAVSGLGQYGNAFDDWGERFVCDNRHHLRHIVIADRYLKRNPFLGAPAPVEDTSVLEEGPLNSGGKVYPLSKNWTTSNLHAGRFTAACGVCIYRGDLLPAEFRGAAFTCEPTGNLVHQEILKQKGATFQSRPPREGVEFLATPDDWCRPVFVTYGPDGAMYVVDMYRAVIEHPEFMPPELRHRPDLTLGKDRGRIWRIVPAEYKGKPPQPRLSKATTPELVKLLEHPNAWWRITAQRLLERADAAAVEPLRQLARTSANPLARVHAAWLLQHAGRLEPEDMHRLLQATHPRVRDHGLQLLAEVWTARALPERLAEPVARLASDLDPRVRFQAALVLGGCTFNDVDRNRKLILEPLAQVALHGAEDRWSRLAVACALPEHTVGVIATLFSQSSSLTHKVTPGRLALIQEECAVVGARRDPQDVIGLVETLWSIPDRNAARWQMAGINGLAEGMGRRGTQLSMFLKTAIPAQHPTAVKTAALLAQFAGYAADSRRDLTERLDAVRLLAHAPWSTAAPVLTRLFTEDASQDIRLASVRALAAHPQPEVPGLLLKSWRTYTPAVRREVAEAMLRQPDRTLFLLKEIEAGHFKASDLDASRTRQLVKHKRADIRTLAGKLLRGNLPADRQAVLARYQEALKLKGDVQRGKGVYKLNCATCHHVAGVGVQVGPDISDTRTKTLEALLVDILNPNQAIDNNYVNYLITTKSGKSLTGIIAAETGASITLKRAEGQTDTILRTDIEDIQSSGISLMPEGLERTISIADMADLLAFLKNWRYEGGAVPLGHP